MLVGQNSGSDTKLERLLRFYDFALRKLFKCEQTYPDVLLKGIRSILSITAGGTQSNRETAMFAACQKALCHFHCMSETFYFI